MNGSGCHHERGYLRPSTPLTDTRNDLWHVLLQTYVQNPVRVFCTDKFLLSRTATALLFISPASRVTHSAQSWTGVGLESVTPEHTSPAPSLWARCPLKVYEGESCQRWCESLRSTTWVKRIMWPFETLLWWKIPFLPPSTLEKTTCTNNQLFGVSDTRDGELVSLSPCSSLLKHSSHSWTFDCAVLRPEQVWLSIFFQPVLCVCVCETQKADCKPRPDLTLCEPASEHRQL